MSWRRQIFKLRAFLTARKPADLEDEISAHIAISDLPQHELDLPE